MGINEEDRQNLFQPFFRSKDARSRDVNIQSNGLGLNICKRIATCLNGDLVCSSDNDISGGC
jgi:signal transduction histidine kinase